MVFESWGCGNGHYFVSHRDAVFAVKLALVYEIAAQGTRLGEWAQRVVDERHGRPDELSSETVRELGVIISESKGKEFSTLMSFVTGRLSVYGEKLVALALTESENEEENIDFSRLRVEPTSIYFCVTEGALKNWSSDESVLFSGYP